MRFFPWKGGQQVEPQPHLEIVDGVQTRYIPNVRTSIDTPDVDKIHGWSHMFDHEPMSIFYCGNWEGRKPQERLIQFSADRPYEDEDPILTPEQIQDIGDADPESDDQILMYEDYEAVLNETF